MNKKQIIVAWVTVVIITVRLIMPVRGPSLVRRYGVRGDINIELTLFYMLPILLIGGLLIYTLRDKKK